ncbi:hypothetical protein [Nocardioides marmotae]|uniref:hypothetical protein n=1 Tax=Nocardioides marmotae TaxID=2663857 RepID=UPI0012B52915|nr:hypothetical protein [Nocardioides marmotae]MBC9732399.1 hypothetical protein [Nocardioides marmotae]MTB83519.1 hypothetical protein [Nocardioides marmotae]
MDGPEAMYADMTSGDPGAVAALESDVRRSMDDASDEVSLIRYAEDTPDWESPSARTRFNMRAWATRAAGEVSFIRLNRAALALQAAESSYEVMAADAGRMIALWRREKAQATDGASLMILRAGVMLALAVIRRAHGTRLAEATEFLVTDPLTDEQEDWLENGLLRSLRRDLENPSNHGPIIPDTLATGDDDGGIPQGLGYDPDSGHLLQTTYTEDGRARLSLIDPETGELVQTVDLGRGGAGDTAPDHAGGVAVHDGTVYVTSSDKPPRLFAYDLSAIEHAAPGSTVPVLDTPVELKAGAYSTIVGDTMYVGTHNEDGPGRLSTYTWDRMNGRWQESGGPYPTPPKVQGIAVRGSEIVFSSSLGRGNGSTLTSYNLHSVLAGGSSLGDPLRTVKLPNMSEGIVALPEGLLTTYESGAEKYSSPGSGDLADLWAALNMTVTPYSDLGLADGGTIEVQPVTLAQASLLFAQVQVGLAAVERQVARMTLAGGVLGDVPEGSAFATAATTHLEETARWLGEGRISAEITAGGLATTAESYEESDSGSGGFLDRLRSLLP